MMIDPRIDKAREYLAGIYSPSSAVISDLLAVIAERDAEVERLRSYRIAARRLRVAGLLLA